MENNKIGRYVGGIQKGKSIFDCSTCNIQGCLYNEQGYCIYSIANIQQRISKACYEDECQVDIEAEADYMGY